MNKEEIIKDKKELNEYKYNKILIQYKIKDLEQKKETINNSEAGMITVGDYYDTTGEIYLKYDIWDKEYHLPFALKLNITSDTQVIGNIAKGKEVKIQYKDLNVPIDELELKSIEVIEK